MNKIIQFEDFSFRYPGAEDDALSQINFSIKKGELVLVCGMSGSGKTTLLRHLKKELTPHGSAKGNVIIAEPLSDDSTQTNKIAFVMQNPKTQIVMNTVWHELAFGLENQGLETEEIERRIAEIANFFGIDEWLEKQVDELSGGEQQILNLASNIILQPEILILDEPTAQLDPIARRDFLNMLYYIHHETGTTIILSEHHLNDLLEHMDKVLFIEEGNVIFDGQPKQFTQYLKQQNHPYLIGLPTASRMEDVLLRYEDGDYSKMKNPLSVLEGRRLLEEWKRKSSYNDKPHETKQLTGEGISVLQAKHLWFRYQREEPFILKDLSLEIKSNRILSILGANGSGKSTLLYILCRALKAQKGKLISEKNYRIAMLGQNPEAVFSADTVEKVLLEFQERFSFSREEMLRYANRFGITHLLSRHPYDLSFGEKQRVALIKALLTDPRILLLDEPTKSLDMVNKQILMDILLELKQEMTIVMVTHDIDFAAEVADDCCMLFNKKIISLSPTNDFLQKNTYFTSTMARITRGYLSQCNTLNQFVNKLENPQNGENSSA